MTAAAATCEALFNNRDGEMEGPMLGNRRGGEAGTLANLLTQSLTANSCFRHCSRMVVQDGSIFRMQGSEGCEKKTKRKDQKGKLRK